MALCAHIVYKITVCLQLQLLRRCWWHRCKASDETKQHVPVSHISFTVCPHKLAV